MPGLDSLASCDELASKNEEISALKGQLDEKSREAAGIAATVLAGEVEMNVRRISERFGSMDKQIYGCSIEPVCRYTGSPRMADDSSNDVYGGGKSRGSGIKMFGDLWSKKGNK